MAYGLYDGTLESTPGLGGYLQQKKLNEQSDAQNLHNGAAVMQIVQAQQAQADRQRLHEALAAGGEPGQIIQSLIKVGTSEAIQTAHQVMSINQAQQGLDLMKGANLSDPDAVEKLATGLSMTGHAAAGPMMNLAKSLRERQAATAEHQAQMGVETPIGQTPQMGFQRGAFADRSIINGPEPADNVIPPEVKARMDENAALIAAGKTPKPFAIGVGQSSNPADNTQRVGGLMQQFVDDPIEVIQRQANPMQAAINASNPLAVAPKYWDDKAAALQSREATLGQQQASLAQSAALAGMRDTTANRRIDVNADLRNRAIDMNRGNILLRMGLNDDGTLNATGEARAQLIASGKMAATQADRGIMARVQEINPKWSNADYQVNLANEKAFTSGKKGDIVRSFSVGVDHLGTLRDLGEALQNGDLQAVNFIGNTISRWTGGPAPTNFEAAKKIVGDEIVKAIVGAGGGVSDREEAAKTIAAQNSPSQLNEAIGTYERLMSGQLRGLHHQYQASGGTKDFNSFLSEEAKTAMAEHPAGSGPKPAGPVRVLNGVTYIKINGQWVQQ